MIFANIVDTVNNYVFRNDIIFLWFAKEYFKKFKNNFFWEYETGISSPQNLTFRIKTIMINHLVLVWSIALSVHVLVNRNLLISWLVIHFQFYFYGLSKTFVPFLVHSIEKRNNIVHMNVWSFFSFLIFLTALIGSINHIWFIGELILVLDPAIITVFLHVCLFCIWLF